MKRLLVLVVILFIGLQSCEKARESEIEMISPEEMMERVETEEIQVIDVRSASEFEDAHIFAAKNIILSESQSNSSHFDTLSKDKPIVIYGRDPKKTKMAIEILKNNGFKEVYELEGGIEDWILLGGKVD